MSETLTTAWALAWIRSAQAAMAEHRMELIDLDRAIGEVNEVTGRGRHTSTSAIMLELPPPGGWVIDTPGVRSFGLSHVTADSIIAAFADLAELTADCPRGCTHETGSVDCALDEAVADGRLPAERLDSFRRMERAWTTPTH